MGKIRDEEETAYKLQEIWALEMNEIKRNPKKNWRASSSKEGSFVINPVKKKKLIFLESQRETERDERKE